MTQDEIIEMAKEAGLIANSPYLMPHDNVMQGIEAFAKLVAAKEREACAKVCENDVGEGPDNGCCPTYWNEAAECCAQSIRARGEA